MADLRLRHIARKEMREKQIAAQVAATPPATPVQPTASVEVVREGALGWNSPQEWEIEQRAFHAAGRADVPKDVQELVAVLWKQYCIAAEPTPSPAPVSAPATDGEVVREVADLIDKLAACRSENRMDEAFLDNSDEIAAAVIAHLALSNPAPGHGEAVPVAGKRWPFVETPGEFAARLEAMYGEFEGDMLAAVRAVLIENPPQLAHPATGEKPAPPIETRISGERVTIPLKIVERLRQRRASQPYDPVLSLIVIDMECGLAPATGKE